MRLDADGLEYEHGWLWRHHISVPRSRIQHTDVTQGPYERRFGLATLVVYTAGTEHASIPIEGLSHETALAFRDALLVRGDARRASRPEAAMPSDPPAGGAASSARLAAAPSADAGLRGRHAPLRAARA